MSAPLVRAKHAYQTSKTDVPLAFQIEHHMVQKRRKAGETTAVARAEPEGTADGPEILAYVNHGRVVADCPFCRSAQIVDPDDPRFYCYDCGNAAVEGLYLPVGFPEDLGEIERALGARPSPANRNWLPGETVERLRAENDVHLAKAPAAPTELVTITSRKQG